ncbi:glycosyltransferase family 2 protein [Cuneatibacter sp. NSJ-177]|uniref:glycosyltransferase family 2 protein n=1 Tax=Cuneatibacter sp. NSJ-177 TaxID=2931401 RepID=UPI001FD0A503|nr:glycosyltransferase family 2 protein [Cuneatibacter sp. NSJ-177]MCJ7836937.1 glycosyltransferase family 2 protein [Cuneatibacter sp. NSJ-177]
MEKKPFFSVILPFYNAEKTLRKAVCSVIEQTFSDFELLLVDDASEDGGLLLAERLAETDQRIRILALDPNVGASRARDAGIREACGAYLLFLDADDTYESRLMEQAEASLRKHPADAVVWGVLEDSRDESDRLISSRKITVPPGTCDNSGQVRQVTLLLEAKSLYGYFWNKAYRTDVWRALDAPIPVQAFNEDIMFNLIFFQNLRSLNVLGTALTHYNLRPETSLTRRFLPDYYAIAMRRVEGLFDQQKSWKRDTPDVRKLLAGFWLRYLLSALERNLDVQANMGHKDRVLFLNGVYRSRLYRELMEYASPEGAGMAALAFCLKKRWTAGCLAVGRAVHLIKSRMPGLFRRLKG